VSEVLVQERAQQAELVEPAIGPPPLPAEAPGSRLGRTVLSVMFLAVGMLAAVDLSGAKIPAMAYIALPLAVIGLGLVVGTWHGRARWLIVLGVILSIALAIGAAADGVASKGDVSWRPANIDQLESTYYIDIGNAVLDLSAVNFTAQHESIEVGVGAGNLTVLLPSDVDLRLQAEVNVGNADVLGSKWNGVGQPIHYFTDDGADGIGGGQLTIRATVDVGNLEVQR
jgi:hypothetical protein